MKYALQLPQPCHEKWNEMTPTKKGSFCDSCKKEVIDFTNISNYELPKKLDTDEKICGRFRPDQLNRPIEAMRNNPMYKAGLMLGLTAIVTAAAPVIAQVKEAPTEVIAQPVVTGKIANSPARPEVITITGIVTDHSGLPLPGANVVLKTSKFTVQTDFDGKFSLTIPKASIRLYSKLEVYYIGYETKTIKIDGSKHAIEVALAMQEDVLGELVIV